VQTTRRNKKNGTLHSFSTLNNNNNNKKKHLFNDENVFKVYESKLPSLSIANKPNPSPPVVE
jgi:hypothetical protein